MDGWVVVAGIEIGISELSSHSSLVSYIYFHPNDLGKGMDLSFLSLTYELNSQLTTSLTKGKL